jgi:hypothetical protein
MNTRVLKELAVAVSTYEDRATGQQKNRYKNIGVMMESTNDRGEQNTFLMLDRSFNPAGVAFKPGSDKILVSMFDPKPRDGQDDNVSRRDTARQAPAGYGAGGRPDLDDSIPFAPEWRI